LIAKRNKYGVPGIMPKPWRKRDRMEAHLFPASAWDSPQPGGFAEYVPRHGTCILITNQALTP
jgi:hypothetical protein